MITPDKPIRYYFIDLANQEASLQQARKLKTLDGVGFFHPPHTRRLLAVESAEQPQIIETLGRRGRLKPVTLPYRRDLFPIDTSRNREDAGAIFEVDPDRDPNIPAAFLLTESNQDVTRVGMGSDMYFVGNIDSSQTQFTPTHLIIRYNPNQQRGTYFQILGGELPRGMNLDDIR